MPENHLFEYAVIRIVPRVEREEFLNVGVILYCADQKFLQARYELDEKRINAFYEGLDLNEIREYLKSLCNITLATEDSGPIGKLPIADRFRWLTATRSTVVQTSKTHPGFCTDAAEMLNQLFGQMVL